MSELSIDRVATEIDNAVALIKKNRAGDARIIFNSLVDYDFEDHKILNRLGRLALHLGENDHAIDFFNKLVLLEPDEARHRFALGTAFLEGGFAYNGESALRDAIKLDPERYEYYIKLAEHLTRINKFEEAVELLQTAVELAPDDYYVHFSLIEPLTNLNRNDEALAHAEKLVELRPEPDIYVVKGCVLAELGRMDEALALIEQAISEDSNCSSAYQELVRIRKFTPEDQSFIKQTEQLLHNELPVPEQASIHFTLGKMYDDIKQWDNAFDHYKKANDLIRAPVEPYEFSRHSEMIKQYFTRSLLQKVDDIGGDSQLPVFIVGLPGSGSTLLEQIIASHPDGVSAGELHVAYGIVSRLFSSDWFSVEAFEQKMDREIVNDYAGRYLNIMRRSGEQAQRIVDKMTDNYIYLGLLYLMFPRARVINATRNPLDVCLSGYFQMSHDHPESSDLIWQARRYRFYRETMDYWKNLLPEGYIIDVSYEDVINDPETQIRRLIDVCGLSWNDRCLEFFESKNAVSTSSLWQLRQPVSKDSKKHWIHYAKYLLEPARELIDYLDAEDVAEFKRQGLKLKSGFSLFR